MNPAERHAAIWVLLIAMIGLEAFVAHELRLVYRTRKGRWTLFQPRAFTRYFAKKNAQYWYHASLVCGAIEFVFLAMMIAVAAAGIWNGLD
ncbi:MAG TPA: hypothetical protein VHU87_12755 [Rhizomicrobium sp.]|jgi:hypothetical protein|nr:hypothetical protein [Rhizomicrobium sp.]